MNRASFDFTDAVVLVTGGGSGIGLAITRAFLDAGATVAVTGRRRERLEQALAGAPAERTTAIPGDLSDPRQVEGVVEQVLRRFGRLDVVVSNAAGYATGPITELSEEAWVQLRATNVDAFFHLAKAALPHLAETSGSLVAVSSVSGLRGDWNQAAYNATKAAITNFVQSLALDWGPRGVAAQRGCAVVHPHRAHRGRGPRRGVARAARQPDPPRPARRTGGHGARGPLPGQRRRAVHHRRRPAGRRRHHRLDRPGPRVSAQPGSASRDSGRTWPPSTTRVWPVIQPASSVARNRQALPTSATLPSRPSGMDRAIDAR